PIRSSRSTRSRARSAPHPRTPWRPESRMIEPPVGPDPRAVRGRRLFGVGMTLLSLVAILACAAIAYQGWSRAWAGFAYGAPSGGRVPTNAPPTLTMGGLRAPPGRVVQVVPHGPAARAGVTTRDRVIAIDGHAIED